jgi:hypothetical protein
LSRAAWLGLLQGLSFNLIYQVQGALLPLLEDPSDIFAEDPKNGQLNATKEQDRCHEGCVTRKAYSEDLENDNYNDVEECER